MRVWQQKENSQFMSLFNSFAVIHKGKRATILKPKGNSNEKPALYHVRIQSKTGDTRAVQVETNAQLLNSKDGFLLTKSQPILPTNSSNTMYVWYGSKMSDEHKLKLDQLVDQSFVKNGLKRVIKINEGVSCLSYITTIDYN